MKAFKSLDKKNFELLIKDLLKTHVIYGPVKKEDGRVHYRKISDFNELFLSYEGHALLPLKKFFLPEKEILFEYEILDNKDVAIRDKLEDLEKVQRILIGARPCDIRGIEILDRVFISEFKDPYYETRRRNTLIIGLTCNKVAEYCFCYFTGSGPDIDTGYDLLLTDLGEKYVVQIGSERGFELVNQYSELFEDASEDDIVARNEIIEKLVADLKEKDLFPLDNIYEKMVRNFNSEIWEMYGHRCLSCGKCNYVCPTCYCFDIHDELDLDARTGRRVRVWDACHFLSFTKVASGEIFRRERSSRLKQRIYHKLVYSVDQIGIISCVGCGRCIEVCTADIDIRELLQKIVREGI